jgi:hypothetical protein
MVAWFDRLLNPAWHRIGRLNSQEAFEVCVLVLVHGYLRAVLRDEFVAHFERLFGREAPIAIQQGAFGLLVRDAQNRPSIGPEIRERLIDEIELGCLSCSMGVQFNILQLEVFRPEEMIEGVGCIALAEINSRLGRKEPTVLAKSGYSRDLDECRVQIALSWMRLTSLQDPVFANMLSCLFFESRWKAFCDGFAKGFSTGLNRIDREAAFARARQDCARLSPMGAALISNLGDMIERRRATTSTAHSLEWEQIEGGARRATPKRSQELLQAVINSTGQRILAEADARGWQTHPDLPIAMRLTLADFRRSEAHHAGFMMVAIAIQLEGLAARDDYNLGDLESAFASALAKKEHDLIEDEARRLGFAESVKRPCDSELSRAVARLVGLHAKNARHCVEALQSGSQWPHHEFYQFLGPVFGGQSEEATLAARFDPVLLPMLAELRQQLAAAASPKDSGRG